MSVQDRGASQERLQKKAKREIEKGGKREERARNEGASRHFQKAHTRASSFPPSSQEHGGGRGRKVREERGRGSQAGMGGKGQNRGQKMGWRKEGGMDGGGLVNKTGG